MKKLLIWCFVSLLLVGCARGVNLKIRLRNAQFSFYYFKD